ncbi:MAG TPA: hypothetical protein PLC89_12645 [Haliscomenobacter sp.]|uniref:hypothetical protein n=1 Tax=Haliscomenobacter sp. TaxID=2717303 RepID=UPI002C018C8A|nr:hypothetical protein [Haliscomenobacter sp.]HOY18145.1 hypothetical protein [Haliscomenobacter sp.]
MLTEILIKPFIEDLEHQGIEDTTPYEHGFLAGMTALSSILSENIDNKAQLFTYLGMAISEGMQWVESQVSERNDVSPIFAEKFPAIDDPRWINPNSSYIGWMCYGISFEGEFIKGKLNIAIAGNFILETDRVFGNGVSKIIPPESPSTPRERQPTPSTDVKENDWDYIPVHDDLPASLIQKYAKKNVWFTTPDNPGPEKPGRAILDLSSNRLQIIETNGNQVKRPYYIQLR